MAWGWLGVIVGEVDEGPSPVGTTPRPSEGVLIRGARAGDPAARAGIREGDIVIAVNGVPVREPRDLQQVVAGLTPGRRVPLDLVRAGKPETLTVEVGEAPNEAQ
jgi:serine protease Do